MLCVREAEGNTSERVGPVVRPEYQYRYSVLLTYISTPSQFKNSQFGYHIDRKKVLSGLDGDDTLHHSKMER